MNLGLLRPSDLTRFTLVYLIWVHILHWMAMGSLYFVCLANVTNWCDLIEGVGAISK